MVSGLGANSSERELLPTSRPNLDRLTENLGQPESD